MRKTLGIIIMAAIAGSVSADASDLYISEVFEGSSSLKYVEIYNAGATAVDLDTPVDVVLRRYSNANVSGTDVDVSGTVPAGGFFVIANNSTDYDPIFGTADQYNSGVGHNGNDEYDLFDGTTIIDTFAGDRHGNDTDFAANQVVYRVFATMPNNGDWGTGDQVADGMDSPSTFWTVLDVEAGNANAAAVGTPGTNSGIEAPSPVSDWMMF